MVSAINSTNIINQQPTKEADIKKLIKYTNNETLKDVPDTFSSKTKSAASSVLFFEGIPLLKFLTRNKKLSGKFQNNNLKLLGQADKESLNQLLKGEGKLTTRLKNYIQHANLAKNVFTEEKAAIKSRAKADKLSKKSQKWAEKLAKNPDSKFAKFFAEKAEKKSQKAVSDCIQKTEKAINSRIAITNPAANNSVKLGKAGTALNKLTKGKFAGVSKFMKSSGGGIMLAFSGIIEGVSEVIPTFQELGAEKGVKQLGKSSVKVIGDTVGFIVGEKAGVALGSAIGTAICPGIGTAVGAVCGFIGGMLGSFAAGNITKAITGKSEREKAKEQQVNQTSQQIANDNKALENLKNTASTKINENMQLSNGKLSEDDKIALQSLENLNTTNPFNVQV